MLEVKLHRLEVLGVLFGLLDVVLQISSRLIGKRLRVLEDLIDFELLSLLSFLPPFNMSLEFIVEHSVRF